MTEITKDNFYEYLISLKDVHKHCMDNLKARGVSQASTSMPLDAVPSMINSIPPTPFIVENGMSFRNWSYIPDFFKFDNVTSFSEMFYNAPSLSVSSLSGINWDNVESLNQAFCNAKVYDFGDFHVGPNVNIINMAFYGTQANILPAVVIPRDGVGFDSLYQSAHTYELGDMDFSNVTYMPASVFAPSWSPTSSIDKLQRFRFVGTFGPAGLDILIGGAFKYVKDQDSWDSLFQTCIRTAEANGGQLPEPKTITFADTKIYDPQGSLQTDAAYASSLGWVFNGLEFTSENKYDYISDHYDVYTDEAPQGFEVTLATIATPTDDIVDTSIEVSVEYPWAYNEMHVMDAAGFAYVYVNRDNDETSRLCIQIQGNIVPIANSYEINAKLTFADGSFANVGITLHKGANPDQEPEDDETLILPDVFIPYEASDFIGSYVDNDGQSRWLRFNISDGGTWNVMDNDTENIIYDGTWWRESDTYLHLYNNQLNRDDEAVYGFMGGNDGTTKCFNYEFLEVESGVTHVITFFSNPE